MQGVSKTLRIVFLIVSILLTKGRICITTDKVVSFL